MPESVAKLQPRFSIAVHMYLWLFFIVFGFVPLFLTNAAADRVPLRPAYWICAGLWPVSVAILLLYAKQRSSGDNMNFRNGLLYVTASMMTGWTYLSFITVFPALAIAFFGAVFGALAGDLRRDPEYASQNWLLLVRFFYRYRMRQ